MKTYRECLAECAGKSVKWFNDFNVGNIGSHCAEEAHKMYMKQIKTTKIKCDLIKSIKNGSKKVLVLDRNFHVYIHGDSSKIESMKDVSGTFIKLYYNEIKN